MIVMISGKQGSGKSTLAKVLEERADKEFKNYSVVAKFADVLYEMHDQIQFILREYCPVYSKSKDGELLQLLGTEWGRKTLSENIWCDIMRSRVDKNEKESSVFIIDDCRFENEFDAFPEALRVRLECPAEIRKGRANYWRDNYNHPSEKGLDKYSDARKFDLYFNTDLDSIDHCVELILAQLLKNSWKEKRR